MANILIVDDDEDAAFVTREMLSGRHEVQVVHNAVEALKILQENNIHVLISDLRMPDHDGFQLMEHARKLFPNLGTVIMSAYYDDSDPIAFQMAKRHADIILPKPFPPEAIRGAVVSLVGLQSMP